MRARVVAGEGLDTIAPELAEMLGDSIDPDDQFSVMINGVLGTLVG